MLTQVACVESPQGSEVVSALLHAADWVML